VTDAKCNAPILDDPLFNSSHLQDLAKLWYCRAAHAEHSKSRSSLSTNAIGHTASHTVLPAHVAASTTKHCLWKPCQSVAEAHESSDQALQELGLIRADRETATGHGYCTRDTTPEQVQTLMKSVVQVISIYFSPSDHVFLTAAQRSWVYHAGVIIHSNVSQGLHASACVYACHAAHLDELWNGFALCLPLRTDCGKALSCYYRETQSLFRVSSYT
jgi:hypothetical protein